MMTGGLSSIRKLVQYLCVFGDVGGIGIMSGSDCQEGLEEMVEAEASI